MSFQGSRIALLALAFAGSMAALSSSSAAWAKADLRSTVSGFEKIENVHFVGSPSIIRGSEPGENVKLLKENGVTDVLIWKVETNTKAVATETKDLMQLGYPTGSILNIPVEWKNERPFKETCRQTLEALRFLQIASTTRGRRVYFHCTAGQDRTGMLAALFLMINGQGTKRELFESEMCAKGYEAGNADKPTYVNKTIRKVLTPQYLKMASLMESGKLTLTSVDDALCDQDPESDPRFAEQLKADLETYVCE